MLFITPGQLVCIDLDEKKKNRVWIKSRMDIATDAAVTVEFGRLNRGNPVQSIRVYRLALLYHNIERWEGPMFTDAEGEPIPCDRLHISQLDPLNPIIEKIAKEIDELNIDPVIEPPTTEGNQKKADAKNT